MGCFKTPKYPFLQVWWGWWVLAGRKVAWSAKKQIFGYYPVGPPTKKVQLLWSSLQREGLYGHFLYRKFASNVFSLSSMAVWMDATGFPSLEKSGFSPETTSQWCHRWARPTSKDAARSHGSTDAFTDSLAQYFQKLWPMITSYAKILARLCTPSVRGRWGAVDAFLHFQPLLLL